MATPYNFPSGTTNAISFGPARVAIKAGLNTPDFTTDDVGYIGEDGVSIEMTSEKRDITQGNPRLIEYSFTQAQSVTIGFTSIEWSVTNFARATGGSADFWCCPCSIWICRRCRCRCRASRYR